MSHRDTEEENMKDSHNQGDLEHHAQKGGLRTMPFIVVNESLEKLVTPCLKGKEKMSHRDTEEENMKDSHNQGDLEHHAQKGGLRTMPFIIVNESLEKLVSYGLAPNMILYLTGDYHMATALATSVLSLWNALSNFLSLFGAFISDSYFGRFGVIAVGSCISLLGTILLWLTAMILDAKPPPCNTSHVCESPTTTQLLLLLSALGFMSIGAGCIRPCSMAFGADQLVKKDTVGNNERVLASYFNWYFAANQVATIIALTLIVYIQDHFGWKVGFGVPSVLMFMSALFFFAGSPLYVKVKVQNKSLFTGLAQVLVVALKNRHITLPPNASDGYYCQSKDSYLVAPSESLTFLNKACIVRDQDDLNPNGSISNPWMLRTVDQVEELKLFIKIIPIWSTGIMIYVTLIQPITVLQARSMNRHITSNFEFPAGSFSTFTVASLMIWISLYDRVALPIVRKFTGRTKGIVPMNRIGIGLIFSCLAMAVGAIVENIRRRIAIEEGLSEDPTSVINMSAMWLAPQFCLSGLGEAFNAVGQQEFYYTHLPKGMSSMASAMFILGGAFASLLSSLIINIVNSVTGSGRRVSWLASNLNKGHYDYYYGLLTFLSFVNFIYFLACCRVYRHSDERKARTMGQIEDLKESLLSKSSRISNTSSA